MSNAIAVRDLDQLRTIGSWLAGSESGSSDPKVLGATAALRLYYANQLGLPPLAAAEISVIKGRLFVSAQLLRALADRNGYRVVRRDDDDKTCTAVLIDRQTGEEIGTSTFTLEDARRAGLIRKGSAWETHPARMLWARASKNVIVDFAPAVALGIMLDDEAAEVIDGEIVSEELGGDPGAATGAAVGMGPPSPPNPDPGGAEVETPGDSAASGDEEPRPDNRPSGAQLKKLDVTVNKMRQAQQITTAEVCELAGYHPTLATDEAGVPRWSVLRLLLTADEASKLISELGYWQYKHPPADTVEHGAQASFEIPAKAKEKAKAKR